MQPPVTDAHARDLFQALVENSSDAMVLLDPTGVVLFASETSKRLLGYASEERVGRNAFEMLHPDDVAATRAAFSDCLKNPGVPLTVEFRGRHKDGTWRAIEATAVNRLHQPVIGGVVVNYQDITDRRRAEEALRASDERLGHIVEHAQDLMISCDPRGHLTYVNPAAARVMRYAEHELIGRHFLTLVREDYREQAKDVYSRQIREATPNTYYELPAVTKNGDTVWVGQHVQLVRVGETIAGVHAIARDISRQKEAEEKLRRSEARYRSLIQGAAYGIYRSTVDGKILDANPAFAHMLGYDSVDEVMSLNMSQFYRSRADRARLIDRHPRASNEAVSAEVYWKRQDGRRMIVHLTARSAGVDADGERCFEGIAEDITEKRALEEQLRQAQKMEAVGRLARGVAHDFNNVLAAIVGCSDLMLVRLRDGDPSRVDAEEIRNAAERGAALTRQLLAFSRRQALEPQVLDLHATVRAFESTLHRLTGPHAVLSLETVGQPTPVRVEPGQIEQVVMNLVVNARDAMPDGGTIDVRLDTIDLDGATSVEYPGMPGGPYARITVRDTGVGMIDEVQRHMFEPFFTTKGPLKGTGLGLSIVYGIAKEAGGTVRFSSVPNEGTTFEVLFPVIEAM